MADYLATYRDAVLNAANSGTPQGISDPTVAKLFSGSFEANRGNAAGGALGVANSLQAAEEKRAAEAARAAQMDANKKKIAELQAMNDPKNYLKVPKDDGGFDFKDPMGKPITAWQYAKVTGEDPDKVLKGSNNSRDLQMIEDWTNMKKLGQAVAAGDSEFVNQVYSQHPELKGTTYQDLLRKFRDSYPTFFGEGYGNKNDGQHVVDPGYFNSYEDSSGGFE